jgi:hypothetical protein
MFSEFISVSFSSSLQSLSKKQYDSQQQLVPHCV